MLEERERRERTFRKLLDLRENGAEAIRGLFQHGLPGGRKLIMVTTPSRLYCFAGPGPLASLFAEYPADASGMSFGGVRVVRRVVSIPHFSLSRSAGCSLLGLSS